MDLSKVAQALRMLADAIDGSPIVDEKKQEVTLPDLQVLGHGLIKAGKKAEFLQVLAEFGLSNLSSAEPKDYPKLEESLKAKLNG